jgi:amino acid permease
MKLRRTLKHQASREVSRQAITSTAVKFLDFETDVRSQQDLKTSTMFFFGVVVVGTWEAYSNTAVISLSNGGPRSSIIGAFVAGAGAWCVVRSLSNMAKQEPYIGAQYRWTKMYCPPGLQPLFWSHIQGWLVTWAWIVSAAVLPYYTASQITSPKGGTSTLSLSPS